MFFLCNFYFLAIRTNSSVLVCGVNTYGAACLQKCGECKRDLCHHVNGTCLEDCKPGFTSSTSLNRCDAGKNCAVVLDKL